MPRILTSSLIISAAILAACASNPEPVTVRIATFNIAMGLPGEGDLVARLESGDDPALAGVAEILQRARPDVVLLNEFDTALAATRLIGENAFSHAPAAVAPLLRNNYLRKSWAGQAPIIYDYEFYAPVNTGVDSGMDLNGNGQTGEPEDAWGFGRFPGQYGMLVLSRFPVLNARTFRDFRWSDMPGALRPVKADGTAYYPEGVWRQLRLSSKSHWDLALDIGGTALHFLVSHPTPSVFDGPEDRNGKRNHDEIRLWADYVQPGKADYLSDDAGRAGGLAEGAHFVIAGDLNADPHDGDSTDRAIMQLLENPHIDASCVPSSPGATEASARQAGRNLEHRGDPAADTSDFNDERVGNLRIDYVLPSRSLKIVDCGVFWPSSGKPGHGLVSVSDHRLVWIDLELPPGEIKSVNPR